MNYRVVHTTEYAYSDLVSQCHNLAHLRPRETASQRCLEHHIVVDPPPSDYSERLDFFENPVTYFSVYVPHHNLTVTATSLFQLDDDSGQLAFYEGMTWETVRDRLSQAPDDDTQGVRQYCLDSPLVAVDRDMVEYAVPSFPAERPILDAVLDLMGRIHHEFAYDPGFSSVSTPVREVFENRRGVCQDFAHLSIACLRGMGLAARYVSGYLETLPPPGAARVIGADASHAWFSVYVPDVGWLDFDPTNNQMPMGQHMTTAWGRDFSDVTPLKGVIFGGGQGHSIRVSVDVERQG